MSLVYRLVPVIARPLALFALSIGLASCAAPIAEGGACREAGSCEAGKSCIMGLCRPPDAPLTPVDAQRVVLAPSEIAVVSALSSGGGGDELPDTFALGRSSDGTVILLMRFAPSWNESAEVLRAMLVLDTIEGPPALLPATIEAARISGPWLAATASWGRTPKLDVPFAAGSVVPRPPIPVRVDVTQLVRDLARKKQDDQGIALLAHGDDVNGTAIALGVSRGGGPRLEVYLR